MKNIQNILRRKLLIVSLCTTCILSTAQSSTIKSAGQLNIADSLYYAGNWTKAATMYESVLKDTSHNSIELNRLGFCYYHLGKEEAAMTCFQRSLDNHPIPLVRASVLSRMARIYAKYNEKQKAVAALDSAANYGYANITEMDSLTEFKTMQTEPTFKELRKRLYAINFPCMVDPHAREFDFWAGNWDVYATGTNTLVGHSAVQIISGGCALLENWTNLGNGNGKSINYVDPVSHKWKQNWAGSYAGGIQEFTNGEYKDTAMHFDFVSYDTSGNKTIGRFIFYNQGPGKVRQFSESSTDDGKTWTTNYDFTYFRKKE